MGVEPFMISASLLMVQAQRLVRRVCPRCKGEDERSEKLLKALGIDREEHRETKFYMGRGCEHCNGTGYKGRAAIYEMMVISEEIKELISKRATTLEIAKKAKEQGMKTLRESGMEKAVLGETSLEEVLRVTLI
jgi:type IV pilus assembly protein PilB